MGLSPLFSQIPTLTPLSPVMMDNQDLRPELIAQTYAHASPSSLPTHPYKKRLGHYQKKGLLAPYPPGVLTMA